MRTAEQRKASFLRELQDLLNRYQAELQVTDDGKDYGMHTGVCQITMPSIYDNDHNLIADYCEFELDTFMSPVVLP